MLSSCSWAKSASPVALSQQYPAFQLVFSPVHKLVSACPTVSLSFLELRAAHWSENCDIRYGRCGFLQVVQSYKLVRDLEARRVAGGSAASMKQMPHRGGQPSPFFERVGGE